MLLCKCAIFKYVKYNNSTCELGVSIVCFVLLLSLYGDIYLPSLAFLSIYMRLQFPLYTMPSEVQFRR